ncbi:ABC transporter substrate-binding protein [Spirochaetia bacterium]|nr:ABC transporter substrate-binding protein [Spirochaetia bacterium]
MIKKIFFILLVSFCLSGCNKQKTLGTQSSDDTVSFTDSGGRTVDIPSNITAVIPSGALTQMFIVAIAPDVLVTNSSAASKERDEFMPHSVLGLPFVGQVFGTRDFNYEEAAKMGAQIVIDCGDPFPKIADDMEGITEKLGIPSIHITAKLSSTPQAFRTLGKVLKREEKAEALALFCEKTINHLNDVVEKTGGKKVSALYCMGREGLNVLSAGTIHSEVLDAITDNKAVVDNPASRGSGNEANMEQINLWNPQVILFAQTSIYDDAANRAEWKELDAIKNKRYYKVPDLPYNWMGSPPSINRFLSMLWLCSILYPQYTDYDLYTEVKEYYKLFYAYELTKEKFDEITYGAL